MRASRDNSVWFLCFILYKLKVAEYKNMSCVIDYLQRKGYEVEHD